MNTLFAAAALALALPTSAQQRCGANIDNPRGEPCPKPTPCPPNIDDPLGVACLEKDGPRENYIQAERRRLQAQVAAHVQEYAAMAREAQLNPEKRIKSQEFPTTNPMGTSMVAPFLVKTMDPGPHGDFDHDEDYLVAVIRACGDYGDRDACYSAIEVFSLSWQPNPDPDTYHGSHEYENSRITVTDEDASAMQSPDWSTRLQISLEHIVEYRVKGERQTLFEYYKSRNMTHEVLVGNKLISLLRSTAEVARLKQAMKEMKERTETQIKDLENKVQQLRERGGNW